MKPDGCSVKRLRYAQALRGEEQWNDTSRLHRLYDNHVLEAAERHEALALPDVHGALLALLPSPEDALALDVGAGRCCVR